MGKTKLDFKTVQLFDFIQKESEQNIDGYERIIFGMEMIKISDHDKYEFETIKLTGGDTSDENENATFVMSGSDGDLSRTLIAVCEGSPKIKKTVMVAAMYFESIKNRELEREFKESSWWEKFKKFIGYGQKKEER